jgi:ATP-dependent Zn protease
MNDEGLRATAYHEAGHAVARYFLRLPFRYVTIRARGDADGYVMTRPFPRASRDRIQFGGATANDVQRVYDEVVTDLAGFIAQRRALGDADPEQSYSDTHGAVGLLDRVCGSNEEVEACAHWLWVRACGLIEARWAIVEAVATALLEARTLTARQVRAAMIKEVQHADE